MVSLCPYICNNKTEYGYCKTTACINPEHRTFSFTSYDPIEIARQYAPKFDKPVVDMAEVVRCKECKYRNGDKDKPYCDRINPYRSFYVGDNDFCSWGEKNGNNY